MDPLESYQISPTMGFILERPLERLPSGFKAWEDIMDNLVTLVQQRRLRDAVNKLPLLDASTLTSRHEMLLGHLCLAHMTSAYVWQNGEEDVPQVLPRAVAMPFHDLSERLGVEPIMSYGDLVIANTRLLVDGPTAVRHPTRDMALIHRISDDPAWDAFFLVTSEADLRFAPAIQHIMEAVRLSRSGDDLEALASHLRAVALVVMNVEEAIHGFNGLLDPDDFYTNVRPFLAGWDHGGGPLAGGLVYEGVSETPRTASGGSAAQSCIIQAVDALLGARHSTKAETFLKAMRRHMLPDHRRFLSDLDQRSRVREIALGSDNVDLRAAYDHLVATTSKFRAYHMSLVAKFVSGPATRNQGNFEFLRNRGTGGQDLIPFLKKINESTRGLRLD